MDKKKLKVAFLNKYQEKVNRGAETFVRELSERLSESFDVDIISEIDYLRILVGKYDVVIPTNGREQVFITRIICWLIGAKMVVSGQSGPGADDKWNLLCMPNIFIALTEFQKSWAKKFNPLVKIVKILNGVDLKKFNSKNKPLKVDLPHPIVLSVGALEKGKRLDLVIKAVQKTNFSLLLVGKGELEKELNEMGKKMLGERFKIISLPFEDMPRVYPAADVFTYPTVPVESFGIVLVEAMASGLPVVATDDPIRREIVGEAGLFVDPIDTENYAEMLKKSVEAKWDGKPRRQAEKFSWDLVAKRYEELFNELVK